MVLNEVISEYFATLPEIYDIQSFTSVFLLKDSKEFIPITPVSLKINFNINSEEQINLKGQVVGLIKSFRGGTLSLELSSADYFRGELSERFETLTEIYVETEEQRNRKSFLDKIFCSLTSVEFGTDDPQTTCKMEFKVTSIYRNDLNSKNSKFSPLFRLNSSYYVRIMDDSTKLKLVYYDYGEKRDTSLTLENVTSFQGSTKMRHEQKRMDESGTWLFLQDGVEPMTISVTARIYDFLDMSQGKVNIEGLRVNLEEGTLSKELVLQNLLKLLNNKTISKKNGELPYEIYLNSALFTDLSPYNYRFFLTKVDYSTKENYIEVSLDFFERREENPTYKAYMPKNEKYLNKSENLFNLRLLANGDLDSENEEKVRNILEER